MPPYLTKAILCELMSCEEDTFSPRVDYTWPDDWYIGPARGSGGTREDGSVSFVGDSGAMTDLKAFGLLGRCDVRLMRIVNN